MRYDIYADLSRRLTVQERSAVADAIDAVVPGSGCIGLQKGPNDEVYFTLEAPSDDEARAHAEHYMRTVLQMAELDAECTIELQLGLQ